MKISAGVDFFHLVLKKYGKCFLKMCGDPAWCIPHVRDVQCGSFTYTWWSFMLASKFVASNNCWTVSRELDNYLSHPDKVLVDIW